jgi:hypothetical protein
MGDRHAHDRRHRLKKQIEVETGAVRMPVVPFTLEMLAEVAFKTEIDVKVLLKMSDLDLGLLIHDCDTRGEKFLCEISQGADESVVQSERPVSGFLGQKRSRWKSEATPSGLSSDRSHRLRNQRKA